MWDTLPEELRQPMVDNAPTFLATMDDPRWADLDVAALSRRRVPLLLTDGDQSPTVLRVIVAELARLVGVAVPRPPHTFAGAGHVPQLTHPSSTSRRFAPPGRLTGHGRLGCHAEGPTGQRPRRRHRPAGRGDTTPPVGQPGTLPDACHHPGYASASARRSP